MLELIPPIIESLAWPVAAVIIICMLRRHLKSLVDHVEKAETRWGNVSFRRGVDDVSRDFPQIAEQPTTEVPPEDRKVDLYAPVAEVLEAWTNVEQLCQKLLAKNGHSVPKSFRALGSRLKKYQLIDSEHATILDKLRQLRNIAAYGTPETVGQREALEYVDLADRMITYLSQQLAEE